MRHRARPLSLASALAVATAASLAIASCRSDPDAAASLDAGPVPDADLADAALEADAGRACPGPAPASYAWSPPVAADPSACSAGDLDRLTAAIASKKGVTEGDIATALGASCAACAIGHVGDPTWRAIVGGHEGYIGNVGGCVVRLGATEACGKAIDQVSTCLIVGCAGCTTRKEQDACGDALTTVDGACAAPFKAMRGACSALVISGAFASNGACQSFVETVRLFCGRPATDGGVDASAD